MMIGQCFGLLGALVVSIGNIGCSRADVYAVTLAHAGDTFAAST